MTAGALRPAALPSGLLLFTHADTLADRLLWSAVAVGLFLLAVAVLWRAGPWLKSRMAADIAEAIQAGTVTLLGGIGATVLVVVWNATAEVRSALDIIRLGPKQGVLLLVTGLGIAGAYTITRVTKRLVRTVSGRGTISDHQQEVLHHLVQILVLIPTVLFILALWGIRPGRLLLGAGVAGVVIGLAARQTLGAVLAGFVVLFSRPFEVGDWVVIDDQEGTVTDISIFNTQLRSFDNEDVLIPNDQVTTSNIVNRSRRGRLRLSVDVGVDYDADPEHAADLIEETVADLDAVNDQPPPDVVYRRFGDSAVVLGARFWISDPTISRKWQAQNAVVRSIKDALAAEGIKIPFPQRELQAREETGGFRVHAGESETSERAVERVESSGGGDRDGNGDDDGDRDGDGT